MPAKAFRTSKTSPAKSAETVVPVTTSPSLWPISSNGAIYSSRSGPPGVPKSSRSYCDSREISGSYHDLYSGIVGNDAVKTFRRHTVPQPHGRKNVCANANVTDQYDAKYIANMADTFLLRFGADGEAVMLGTWPVGMRVLRKALRRDRLNKWPRTHFRIFTQ